MKQHITKQQLDTLSQKGKEKLKEWWQSRKPEAQVFKSPGSSWAIIDSPELPLLSIGQMIEFLDKAGSVKILTTTFINDKWLKQFVWRDDKELCDALWENVREILIKR